MGGEGSTRWRSYERKLTTAECHALHVRDVRYFVRRGHQAGVVKLARLVVPWVLHEGSGVLPLVSSESGVVVMWHRAGRAQRLYFRCGACHARIMTLYCPPTLHRWGCRTCYQLVYQSSQRSRKCRERARRLLIRANKLLRSLQQEHPVLEEPTPLPWTLAELTMP